MARPEAHKNVTAPLLRAPPFPWPAAASNGAVKHTGTHKPAAECDKETLLDALREARVGGAFWATPFVMGKELGVVVRPIDRPEESALLAETKGMPSHSVLASANGAETDPWSVLAEASKLIAHGNDEWVAIASILGVPVQILSPGRFGHAGDSADDLLENAIEAACEPMPDPFGEGLLKPLDAIRLLGDWRRFIDGNRGEPVEPIVAAYGMAWWKRAEIRRFLWLPEQPLTIFRSASQALKAAKMAKGALAVWPSKMSPDLERKASTIGVNLVRIEDGFVRSAGLGSNLVPPQSVIVDRRGVYFDPRSPSDLEIILSETNFTRSLLIRAAELRTAILDAGISKYARSERRVTAPGQHQHDHRIVLVPGQVEDDLSVVAGGDGLTSNLELLRRTRQLEPDAEIWWRPHPDVDAGHRKGFVDDDQALKFADKIVRKGGMAELLDEVDGVHVLTSLTGFEALMRGLDVTCHGTPFYAGWGLTRDLGKTPERRARQLSLDELVAAVLILYPRYLDPVTGLPCPPEILVKRMANGEANNRLGWVEPIRRAQGEMMARLRTIGNR